MKRNFFTAILILLFMQVFAESLFKSLAGPGGVSEHFVTFEADRQQAFAPGTERELLGLDPSANLVLSGQETDGLGFTHYRYYQTYQGIPVENSMYLIHTKNGRVAGLSGEIIVEFDGQSLSRLSVPVVSADRSLEIALDQVKAVKYAWESPDLESNLKDIHGDPYATHRPVPGLVWYSDGQNLDPRNLRLAYKVEIYALKPLSKAIYFIDAQNGQLLGVKDRLFHVNASGTANTLYSGTQTIISDLVSGTYYLRDYSRGNGIVTRNAATSGYPVFTNTSANWSLTGKPRNALDIHWGLEMTYDFYKNKFNRNSLNNAGLLMTGYANEPNTTNNAYWDGSAMWFGTRTGSNNGVTGIDVVGHELTHGVTQYTCNLNYSYESGAINESLSDIMGKAVQFVAKPTDINWVLSNDMNWNIRSLSNPNAYSQPDTYQGTYWYSGTGDNGGVHYNSGVGNFMFYLLVNGGSGTNDKGNAYTVAGVGLDKAIQIVYRSQTVYLVSTSKYADWRTACINAATDLYGSGAAEVNAVMNAFYAVGIGAAAGATCGTPTGLAASSVTTSGATVSWTAVSGATSYTLQYKTSAATTWTTVSGITTTSRSLTGLSAGTTYNYQVSATCSSGTSPYSTAATFTTGSSATCGTPTGLAASSVTTSGATVSWTAVSGATSYTLQYKTSAATTWTTVSGITTTSRALTGLSAGTTYNYQVSATCSGGTSPYSTAASFTTASTISYCAAKGSSQAYEWIDLVRLFSINRTSGKETGGYVNTGLSTNLVIGSVNDTIRFSAGFTSTIYTEYWRIYIDYNKNGVFTDAGETIVSGSATGSGSYYSVFSVPSGLTPGPTRMRVVMSDVSSATSCGTFNYGEVEDYTINLTTSLSAADNGSPSENSGIVMRSGSVQNGSFETVVEKRPAAGLERELTLMPNPFRNGTLSADFSLPAEGVTVIRISDMTGREIASFPMGSLSAGAQRAELAGLDDLSGGVYLLLVEVDGLVRYNARLAVVK